jgi:DNA-binding Lrp family transcriptional regulator
MDMQEKILRLLENDSSYTHEQIVTMLDIPVEQVKAAIAEMFEKGIILKYCALIDWEKNRKGIRHGTN